MRLTLSAAPLLFGAVLACDNTRLDLLRPAIVSTGGLTASTSSSESSFEPPGSLTTEPPPTPTLPLPSASNDPTLPTPDDAGPAGCAAQGALTEDTYRLVSRVNLGCIQAQTEVVRVGTKIGYALAVTAPCPSDASDEFRLTAMLNGGFQIRYLGSGDPAAGTVIDVKMGSDLPGTPLILYEANGLANQQFRFNVRANGFAAIFPGNSLNLCVAVDSEGHVLTETCNLAASEQEWQILPPDCPAIPSVNSSTSPPSPSASAFP